MKLRFTMLVAILGLTAAVVAPACAETIQLRGTVPFSFIVGDQTMPAGEYTLKPYSSLPGRWVISSRANQAGFFLSTTAGASKQSEAAPRLVFNRYGDRYFLSQIWTGAGNQAAQVRLSRTERAAAKSTADHGTAVVAVR